MRKKVIIMEAAGRDFCGFNYFFRDNKDYEVVAFTGAQIPDIVDRKYSPSLAGRLCPKAFRYIAKRTWLGSSARRMWTSFAYSDVSH